MSIKLASTVEAFLGPFQEVGSHLHQVVEEEATYPVLRGRVWAPLRDPWVPNQEEDHPACPWVHLVLLPFHHLPQTSFLPQTVEEALRLPN